MVAEALAWPLVPVRLDRQSGVEAAMRQLVAQGRRAIAYVGGAQDHTRLRVCRQLG